MIQCVSPQVHRRCAHTTHKHCTLIHRGTSTDCEFSRWPRVKAGAVLNLLLFGESPPIHHCESRPLLSSQLLLTNGLPSPEAKLLSVNGPLIMYCMDIPGAILL